MRFKFGVEDRRLPSRRQSYRTVWKWSSRWKNILFSIRYVLADKGRWQWRKVRISDGVQLEPDRQRRVCIDDPGSVPSVLCNCRITETKEFRGGDVSC